MKNLKKFGPYFIFFAALLWGLDGVLRRSLFDLPPIIVVFYEHIIGLAILSFWLLPKIKTISFTKKEWGALFLVSLLSGVLGTLWFTTALTKTNFISFSVVFLLQKLQPIFAMFFAVVFLKEKITTRYIAWALAALVAAYFVTFPSGNINLQTGQGTAIAALFALGAAFAWGSSTAFSRFLLLRHSNTLITGLRFLLTSILSLVFVFILGSTSSLGAPTDSQFLRFVVIALSTGMLALWIYYKGLKNTQVKVSTILELTFPLVAVLIDIILYKNFLQASQYLAAVILLLAMYMVARQNTSFDKLYKSRIVSGAGRGHRIGFPTINMNIPKGFEHSYGIYCGYLMIENKQYKAAFHYGAIPTFKEKKPSLEAYVLDGHIDNISSEISFRFIAKLRDVEKFYNKDKLVANIEEDVRKAKNILK
ncbi:EamA family transporter [Patescibacteria group bacterium]|nr:EamA family transporter [Patescibacteria group bacterium]